MLQDVFMRLPPCDALYSFHSHAYELLPLTHSAKWSEPSLHGEDWPPTHYPLEMAFCHMGKRVSV